MPSGGEESVLANSHVSGHTGHERNSESNRQRHAPSASLNSERIDSLNFASYKPKHANTKAIEIY